MAWHRLDVYQRRSLGQGEVGLFSTVNKVLALLSARERNRLKLLMVISTIAAVVEVLGIVTILPFIAVVANQNLIQDNSILSALFEAFNFRSKNWFLVALGSALLIVFLLTNAFNALVVWATLRFGWGVQASVSGRLLASYLYSPYSFFLTKNSSELSVNVLTEVTTVVLGTVIAGTRFVSKATAAVFILALLFWIDPLIAAVAITVLGGSYGILFGLIRARLRVLGEARLRGNAMRFKTAGEALDGIKDAKLLGTEHLYLNRFIEESRLVSGYQANIQTVSQLPRYALASVAFGGLLLLVLLLLATDQKLDTVLPVVGLYAFAGYRLMPALQEMFSSASLIRSTSPALEKMSEELERAARVATERSVSTVIDEPMPLRDRLEFRGVTFTYPGGSEPVISNLSLTVAARTSVGFVGGTGAGKTTIVDLILGLIEPDEGEILIDGKPLGHDNRVAWQKSLGYVQQEIYLSDASIAENIAFGVPMDQIDLAQVEQVARQARMMDFVDELPEGFRSVVGERGIRLSGGQRQRIGIARALYRDPGVLVLDEATNALDGITESHILRDLEQIERKTTITVAHRVKAVANCDVIYLIDRGHIAAGGTHGELMRDNAIFQAMAGLSDDAIRE